MGKFDGILILSDMDGTLTHECRISDENAGAIRYFQENGGCFSVATGRQPWYIKTFEPIMTVNAPVIALNGTVVYNAENDEILFKQPLTCSAQKVLDYVFENHPEINTVCANHLIESDEWNRSENRSLKFDFDENEIMKLLFVSPNPKDILNLKYLLTKKFPEFVFLRSWETGLEMLPPGCGKGECIKFIKNCLPVKTVVGTGDYENDITLITMADIGYAAKNSAPQLLEKAKYVSCDCREHIIKNIVEDLEKRFFAFGSE